MATYLFENPFRYLLKIGGLLRKISLNELPNLINIVKGKMVFVGQRPALYNQDDLVALHVAAGVHKLKPSIKGWAQINCRDEISLVEKGALEKDYLAHQLLWFDLKIIFLTFSRFAGHHGGEH